MFSTIAGLQEVELVRKTEGKRKQVAKACLFCRRNRIKCDDGTPCRNCQHKGTRCRRDEASEARTLVAANNEIEKLKSKISTLEQDARLSKLLDSTSNSCHSQPENTKSSAEGDLRTWGSVMVYYHMSASSLYHGPSSSAFFSHRLSIFLNAVLEKHLNVIELQPTPSIRSKSTSHQEEMPQLQQETLLNLFWQTYGCSMPINCEEHFQEHFTSLWTDGKRSTSPLVDIMLALCLQYGVRFISREYVDVSGWYYRRCRDTIFQETASTYTLETYILMIVYLQNMMLHNPAYNFLGIAVNMAQSLGLHLDQASDLPQEKAEHRKRIWWALYILDTRLSVELGRPWTINQCQISLPDDGKSYVGKTYNSFEGTSCLAFFRQMSALALAARSAHVIFYEGRPLDYSNAVDLEESAMRLRGCMESMKSWAANVPSGLKLRRKHSSPLSIEKVNVQPEEGPPWIQLQRVSLELMYHGFCLSFYRQFIYYTPHSMLTTPLSDGHATTALNHGIAITSIVHQMLTKYDTIAGWHDAHNLQWDAALTVMAFSIANPICPPTITSRKTIDIAVEALEISGTSNAPAIIKSLQSKAKSVMDHFRRVVNVTTRPINWPSNTSPWLTGSDLSVPNAGATSLDQLWPDVEQEMWVSFLHELDRDTRPGTLEISL